VETGENVTVTVAIFLYWGGEKGEDAFLGDLRLRERFLILVGAVCWGNYFYV
jgi:hypothetical protein